jgi:hypothetical protein
LGRLFHIRYIHGHGQNGDFSGKIAKISTTLKSKSGTDGVT